MTTRALWIPQVCRQFGLTVVETDGWQGRGAAVSQNFRGVVGHHTAGGSTGELPSLRTLINGRSDLPGPLCNCGLARSGTVYAVASGRANHAGQGDWRGLSGNSSVLGIEAENDGRQDWPAAQLRAYDILIAALLYGIQRDSGWYCGHKEWAKPKGRKIDPHTLSMDEMRVRVSKLRPGGIVARPQEDIDVRGLDPAKAPTNVPWLLVKANSKEERTLPDLLAAATMMTGPHFLRGLPVVRVNQPSDVGASVRPPDWSITFGFRTQFFEKIAGPHWEDTTEGTGTARLMTERLGYCYKAA